VVDDTVKLGDKTFRKWYHSSSH